MRLFAAIPVGSPAIELLDGLLSRWRATDWPVKWVRSEGLHLTLKFLGPVADERLGEVREALAGAVAGTPMLSFTLTGPGAFPSFDRARILWAGLESEPALELMVHRIEAACAQLGFPLEGRPYRPHVTLGRVREGGRLSDAAVATIGSTSLDPVSYMSASVVLFQSLTGPGGSHYEARGTFPLGAR